MLLKNKIKEIKNIVNNNNVLTEIEERYCYSQDSSNIKMNTKLPDAIVFVESINDVINIIKFANKNKIPIIARGAGTNMVGACTCPNGGIVLNFSKMNQILDFNPLNMTIKVQPGVVLADLKDFVEKEGLFYPPDPSNLRVSTIGGSIAQSSGGAMSFKYGTTKDYILSLTVVMADGTVTKLGAGTIKDAVGYHLNQLIVGSEGTLAIVVEAELKLIPKPETTSLVVSYFDSTEYAVKSVTEIIKEQIFPSTLDFMDKNSITTVEQFFPCGLCSHKNTMLLIELDGHKSSMEEQINKVKRLLNKNNADNIKIATTKEEIDSIWTARRASFAATAKLAPDVVSDDIVVPRCNIAKMVEACQKICKKYNLSLCLVGHIGDGNLHPQIALDLEDEQQFKNYLSAKSEIYDTAIKLNGTISAEHGIGNEKISYIKNVLPECNIKLMKEIKKIFDPNNILNPGKIF